MLLAELVHFLCVERARGKIAHAASVESLIAVLCTLVILRRGHDLDRLAVHIGKHRYLASGHELLHDHRVSRGAELLVLHDLLDARLCLLKRVADQNTLSECQSVRLQYDRHLCRLQIVERILCRCEILVGSRRNVIFFHQILGKCLGALKDRRILPRSEHL